MSIGIEFYIEIYMYINTNKYMFKKSNEKYFPEENDESSPKVMARR